MNTQLFAFFLTDWQLASAGLHSDLVTVDADWHRLNLLTDSTSPETQTQIWNWLRQLPPRTFVVHCLQTVHCWLPLPCVDDGRTAASSAAVSWLHHMQNICYLRDSSFKKLSNQNSIDIPMQTSKALFVANSKISTNAHLVRICLKMGVQGMFCSSKLQVK